MQLQSLLLIGSKQRVAVAILFSLLTIVSTIAQSPGNLDLSFDPGGGLDGILVPLAVQPDGKVLVSGGFRNIARLNADGTLDTSFHAETDASVEALALQPDGKILIGGWFIKLARLNPDGTRDSSFDPGAIAGSPHDLVSSIVLQPDGRILIAGLFDSVQGQTRPGIARLSPDGTLDSTFDPGPGVSGGLWPRILSVALQPDGKILIGGTFRTVNGTDRAGIARLHADGGLDTSFVPPSGPPFSGADPNVTFILQPDGKIVTGDLQRLNSDGTRDLSFSVTTVPSIQAYSLALQPDGKLLVSGAFTNVNGTARNGIARVHSDGTLDTTFDPGSGPMHTLMPSGLIFRIQLQPDGKLLVGGQFTSMDGVSRDGIARLNPDGSVDLGFDATGSGPNGPVQAVAPQPDGKVLIGGQFTEIQRTSRPRIARLNADGSLDPTFDPGTGLLWEATSNQTSVQSLIVQPDGKVLIGGRFSQFNGTGRTGLARLNADGTLDSGFNPVMTSTYEVVEVNSAALQADGKILIGGEFSEVNGTLRNRVARLHPDGTLDPGFDPGPGPSNDTPWSPPTIHLLVLQADGRVVVKGDFTQFGGIPRAGLAQLNPDGSLDTSFVPGALGENGSISAVAAQPDGKVLVGGRFTSINGVNRNDVARLNSDGTVDHTFDPGTGLNDSLTSFARIFAVVWQPDGKILIGGRFTGINGTNRAGIARLHPDGSLDPSFDPGTGPDREITSMALQANSQVLIGGGFTAFNGVPRWRVARLHGDGMPSPVQLTIPQRLEGGPFQFTITGEGALGCTIQISTDLVHWSDLESIVPTTSSSIFTDPTAPAAPFRFYRVKY